MANVPAAFRTATLVRRAPRRSLAPFGALPRPTFDTALEGFDEVDDGRGLVIDVADVLAGHLARLPAREPRLEGGLELGQGDVADGDQGVRLIWVVVGDRERIEDSIRELDLGPIRFLDADGNPVEG